MPIGFNCTKRVGLRVQKVRASLQEIGPESIVQEDIFARSKAAKREFLLEALDEINASYGRGTLRLSTNGSRQIWELRANKAYLGYTTIGINFGSAVRSHSENSPYKS